MNHLGMMQDINRCALITASSKGLGRALATVFSENGYDIILHGRDAAKIKQARKEIEKNNIKVYEVIGDLREEATIQSLFDISKDRVSVLINNAAIPCYGLPIDEMNVNQIMNSLDTNLISPIVLTQKIYPLLKKQGCGSIININSIVGKEPKKFRSVHSATKWGLKGFSKSLRIEAEDDGVKVINVYPTRIKTTPEFTYGMNPIEVAQKIYEEHTCGATNGELVIDGRPEEYRPNAKGIKK